MVNFVRKNIRVSLGDNGKSYMMARGYGDMGAFKRALFVPGLTKDLISTQQFDLEGLHESTAGGRKRIWSGRVGESNILLEFRLQASDLFYHLVDPYAQLAAPRSSSPPESAQTGEAERSDVTVSKDPVDVTVGADPANVTVGDRVPPSSCTDSKLKLRKTIRKLVGERTGEPIDGAETDPVLASLVRKEVRRLLRGSRGAKIADGTVGLNDLQLLHVRLGHASRDQLLRLLKSGAAKGLGTTYEACKDLPLGICDACLRGKCDAMHIPSSESASETVSAPFTDLHMDIKEMT
ncbi:hypothetical protein B484DRAFT_405441, partial [Ochromonadaceae sp. CCMP2298]